MQGPLSEEDVRIRQPDEDGEGDDDDRHEDAHEEPPLVAQVHEVEEYEDGLRPRYAEHDDYRDPPEVQARRGDGEGGKADEGRVDEEVRSVAGLPRGAPSSLRLQCSFAHASPPFTI